ncbi:unnamed protein product [Sphagnum jensenii]
MNVLRPAERVALASSWMYCIRKDGVVVSRLLRHTLLSGLGALGSSSSGFWPSRQSHSSLRWPFRFAFR